MLRVTSIASRAYWVLHHSFPVVLSGVALSVIAPGCGSDDASNDSDGGGNGDSNSGGSTGGNNGSTGGNSNGSNTSGGGNGGGDEVVGRFVVNLVEPTDAGGSSVPGFTSVTGKVYDGPSPGELTWSKASEDGGCVLLKPVVPFCDPPCGSDVCVADDKCLANPTTKDVGEVKVEGLSQSVTLKNIQNAYQIPAGITLPYPAFAEGAVLKIDAAGGEYGAFSITSKGIAPLVLSNDAIALDSTKPLTLTWEPPTMTDVSRIHVKLDISHHGGTKGKIECDVEDNGSLSISGQMIGMLTSLGVAGFPTISVTRSSSGTAPIAPGLVELAVSSDVERAVEIPGLTSCTGDEDCPDGQTCQADLTCK